MNSRCFLELNELIARVEDAGITVSWVKLQRCNAGWDASTRTIWLRESLFATPRRAVSVLAHEFGHFLLGHDGPQSPGEEARADMVAAGILIDPADYAHAERIFDGDAHLIARDLGVTVSLVRAFQGTLVPVVCL